MTRHSPLEDMPYWIDGNDENVAEIDEQLFCEFMIDVGWLEEGYWWEWLEQISHDYHESEQTFPCPCLFLEQQIKAMDLGFDTLEVQR